jgi:hypothetical protein
MHAQRTTVHEIDFNIGTTFLGGVKLPVFLIWTPPGQFPNNVVENEE